MATFSKASPSTGLHCSTTGSRANGTALVSGGNSYSATYAVLPPDSDDRIEVLRERIEVAPFDEAAHIELIRTLLRRALYTEADHQIDASVTLFQSEDIDATSLKSAFAAAQRSVSKSARMSLVDVTHLDARPASKWRARADRRSS